MLKIGEYNTLAVARIIDHGVILRGLEFGQEVLLPKSLCPDGLEVNDELEVFVYTDSEDRNVATTEKPYATINQFAYLKVVDVNDFGAFLDWGLQKDLFVPFKQQPHRYHTDEHELVYVLLDDATDRVVGIGKFRAFFTKDLSDLEEGQEVDALVYDTDDLGFRVLVNNEYNGLLFASDLVREPKLGEKLKLYIKTLRKDGKIDLVEKPPREQQQLEGRELILERLKQEGGKLPFNSKSSAEVVHAEFNMSRKIFKKTIGALYKERLIDFTDDGMILK